MSRPLSPKVCPSLVLYGNQANTALLGVQVLGSCLGLHVGMDLGNKQQAMLLCGLDPALSHPGCVALHGCFDLRTKSPALGNIFTSNDKLM